MNDKPPFTFLAQKPPRQDSEEILYANGIFADTGLPLCELNVATAAQMAEGRPGSEDEQRLAKNKYDEATNKYLGVSGGVDPAKLEEAGWGIVFHANASPELKKALQPLIEHRRRQVASEKLFLVFENADGYRTGESCVAWLARHKVTLNVVEPVLGVPYYLLLVGSPAEIPFEFQYLLDIYWAVGRLHFDDPADYRRYAESVVEYEQAPALPHTRSAALFATRHELDKATELFADLVAAPLTQGDDNHKPLGEAHKFKLEHFIGKNATKENLTRLLQGKTQNGPPSLLFTGSHGMGFRPDDTRLPETQGALVCQDWAGWGNISADDWFAARDVPNDAQIHGLIHFFFACYGAGCPRVDDFVTRPGEQEQIAPRALIARLPQKLLAHPNGGALAALGHVDRAWSHSFHSTKAGAQLQGFRDVMGRLLRGERLGQATDQFDVRRAALSSELTDVLKERGHGNITISDQQIASLWIARNDARNYVVLGDPAVRLRIENLTEKWTARRVVTVAQPTATSEIVADQPKNQPPAAPPATETKSRRTPAMSKPSETVKDYGLFPNDVTDKLKEKHPDLFQAWENHIKQAYKHSELMFKQLLKAFIKPYWITVGMQVILFAIGISSFVASIYFTYRQDEIKTSILFGGLSVLSFLGYFISRPLRSLEQNLMFITWLGLIYNTYWARFANCLNEPTVDADLAKLQKDASQDLERLITKHTEVAAKLPDVKDEDKKEDKKKEEEKEKEKDKEKKMDKEKEKEKEKEEKGNGEESAPESKTNAAPTPEQPEPEKQPVSGPKLQNQLVAAPPTADDEEVC